MLAVDGKLAGDDDCCCPPCVNCSNSFGPEEWQVDLAGFANGNFAPCANCTALNGFWVMGDDTPCYVGPTGCKWGYSAYNTPNICAVLGDAVCMQLTVHEIAGTYYIEVYVEVLTDGNDAMKCWFRKSYGGNKPDCQNLSDEVIPFWKGEHFTGFPGREICSFAGATCSITAL